MRPGSVMAGMRLSITQVCIYNLYLLCVYITCRLLGQCLHDNATLICDDSTKSNVK